MVLGKLIYVIVLKGSYVQVQDSRRNHISVIFICEVGFQILLKALAHVLHFLNTPSFKTKLYMGCEEGLRVGVTLATVVIEHEIV
jgi:hypothetical protein